MRRWLPWAAMALVLVGALTVGVIGERPPRTEADQVQAIAEEVRCPTCRSQSAAESDAAAAEAIRAEIRERLRAGESKGEILAFLASRYGDDVLLRPEARGVSALVWALPVAALILAAAGLAAAFRRWRSQAGARVTESDRQLVEEALRS